METNDSTGGCCLGITGIIICGLLTCLAPGFLITSLLTNLFDFSSGQIWGFSLALSTIIFFLLKIFTEETLINYVKTCILSAIIIVVLGLILEENNFIERTVKLISPPDTTTHIKEDISIEEIPSQESITVKEQRKKTKASSSVSDEESTETSLGEQSQEDEDQAQPTDHTIQENSNSSETASQEEINTSTVQDESLNMGVE